ncbi:MAG: efflux RND transporter periplasmic adaptor subunit [Fimbriimonadaceae bacterium]|nr:efflux RND transporter periplasmic adaptor subunit [Fimbriimonadaceae bacterium]
MAAVFVGGCVDRAAQEDAKATAVIVSDPLISVALASAQTRTLAERIEVTGSLATGDTTRVGAKNNGRLLQVFVTEGSTVSAGQTLAVQDTSLLRPQLDQAIANVSATESQLAQTLKNAQLTPNRSKAQVQQAEAALRQARANLQKGMNGARPQERAQAEAQLASAKTNLDVQRLELTRVEKLVSEGAVAASRLDQQRNAVASAEANYRNAAQAVSLINEGTRREDIASLREAVRAAESALSQAKASQELDVLLLDQVRSARAQVESARATVRLIREQIDDATIKAPFAGTVVGKPVQPGTVLAPGTPVCEIVGDAKPYFEANVPEQALGKLVIGQGAMVTVSALNRTLPGRIASLNPIGTEFGRQFSVRINLGGDTSGIKAGMFARGVITLAEVPNAVIVPSAAIVERQGKTYLFTVVNDAAKMQPITRGLRDGSMQQVNGIAPGTRVVVRGQEGLDEGTKVKVESAAKTDAKSGGEQG